MFLYLLLFVLALLVVVWLIVLGAMILAVYGSIAIRVPFVPVAQYVVEALKKEEPLKAGDVFYDLGSGDGRAVLAMARAFPEAHTVGVEKGPLPYLISRLKLRFAKTKNAAFFYKDFSKISLADATHVYMYLYPDVVQKLLPKLESELKPGATVIVCDFPFKTRTPKRTVPVVRGKRTYTLYFYGF